MLKLTTDQKKLVKRLKEKYEDYLGSDHSSYIMKEVIVIEEMITYLNPKIDVEKIENRVFNKWWKENK